MPAIDLLPMCPNSHFLPALWKWTEPFTYSLPCQLTLKCSGKRALHTRGGRKFRFLVSALWLDALLQHGPVFQNPGSYSAEWLLGVFLMGKAFPSVLEGKFPAHSTSRTSLWLPCHPVSHVCAFSNNAWASTLGERDSSQVGVSVSDLGIGTASVSL